jgi:hypothetical protein
MLWEELARFSKNCLKPSLKVEFTRDAANGYDDDRELSGKCLILSNRFVFSENAHGYLKKACVIPCQHRRHMSKQKQTPCSRDLDRGHFDRFRQDPRLAGQ